MASRRWGSSRVVGVLLITTIAASLWLIAAARPALAHADFVGSNPADEQVLSEPVTEIVLQFSATVYPDLSVGRLLDSEGRRLETTVFQRAEDQLVVQPADTLTDGIFALVWETASEDGHRVEGALRFTVVGPETAATSTTTTTSAVTVGSDVVAESPPTTFTPTRPPVAAPATSAAADDLIGLRQTSDQPADFIGSLGRWASLLGALIAIGATAFAAFALTGTPAEIGRVVRWIRGAGLAVVAGTLTEVLMLAVTVDGWAVLIDPIGILHALPTSLASAAVLRVAGGFALLQSPTLVTTSHRVPEPALVGGADVSPVAASEDDSARLLVREEWLILAGLLAIAASYLVDGHSASLGVLGRAANAVHVIAGGVWLGGVIVLGDLVRHRRRIGVPTRLAESIVRFSHVATVALIAVAAAGSGLLWSILEDPADLPSRTWGRLLLGKILLVAVAAGIGAYNHYRVVPRLDRDPERAAVLGRTLAAEGIILVLVVVVTAALVVSAP